MTFLLLLFIKGLSRLFYTRQVGWVGSPPPDPWRTDIRICAILHHTSLYEPIFATVVPNSFVWRIAHDAVVPVAEKTLERPIVGRFFRFVAGNVVGVTRQRDETWRRVIQGARPGSLVILLPEGRMQRPNGLDGEGKSMTVLGGISDLILAVDGGTMLLAYSGGLHHIQAPGERLPRIFQTVRMNLELLDIVEYRREIESRVTEEVSFRRAVVLDLERRRDLYCPTTEERLGIPEHELPRTEAADG